MLVQPAAGQRSAAARRAVLLAAALLLAMVAPAQTIYGLGTVAGSNVQGAPVGQQALITIDATTGASLNLTPTAITGVTPGQTLVGIDFRPADNVLYGLGYDAATAGNNAQLYVLNTTTNVATPVSGAIRLELGGTGERIGFDFNPVADLIRVVSTSDANYRLSPATGALAGTDANLNYAGGTPADPGVGTVAYTNSFAGSPSTTLYGLDYLNNGLLSTLALPNSGAMTTQSTVMFVIPSGPSAGTYGIGTPHDLELDIYYDATANTTAGYLTEVTDLRPNGTRASNLYRLDLATGIATLLGNTVPASTLLNFEIRDLAVAIPSSAPLTWNGNTSSDWDTAANWTPSLVPTALNNVTIPGGTPHQPSVAKTQRARNLSLNTGAVLSLTTGSSLNVGNPLLNP